MGSTLIYGNTDTDPEKFMGMTPRYNDASAENERMVVEGADTGGSSCRAKCYRVRCQSR